MTREQFTSHVKKEQGQLRKFLLALCCGNADTADDIAQDSLIKAFMSCEDYRDDGRFTAWIYRIAYRTFLDYKKHPEKHLPLNEASCMAESFAPADSAFCYQELYSALDELPPKERTALLLYYIKGYAVREIGQIMDASEDAVKKQLSRGREHLKSKIKR